MRIRTAILAIGRVATSFDPAGEKKLPQFLPAASAAAACALWIFASGHSLWAFDETKAAAVQFWASLFAASWLTLQPVAVPILVKFFAKPAPPPAGE